ncbi:MAG: hypothetical protein Faunusvirus7_3 [Faunusvirus sp.]|jgi:hypothetical protein|uniref:C3H1-type domain-containing protein n=1 Tax=Faunusvirus sp. TaxID=2487766 RepID=A0A3G4ZWJ4_9VIRU|nr:MAG: hypothetical protein Faunusvirus7_3 [Faunusvirus sp.]
MQGEMRSYSNPFNLFPVEKPTTSHRDLVSTQSHAPAKQQICPNGKTCTAAVMGLCNMAHIDVQVVDGKMISAKADGKSSAWPLRQFTSEAIGSGLFGPIAKPTQSAQPLAVVQRTASSAGRSTSPSLTSGTSFASATVRSASPYAVSPDVAEPLETSGDVLASQADMIAKYTYHGAQNVQKPLPLSIGFPPISNSFHPSSQKSGYLGICKFGDNCHHHNRKDGVGCKYDHSKDKLIVPSAPSASAKARETLAGSAKNSPQRVERMRAESTRKVFADDQVPYFGMHHSGSQNSMSSVSSMSIDTTPMNSPPISPDEQMLEPKALFKRAHMKSACVLFPDIQKKVKRSSPTPDLSDKKSAASCNEDIADLIAQLQALRVDLDVMTGEINTKQATVQALTEWIKTQCTQIEGKASTVSGVSNPHIITQNVKTLTAEIDQIKRCHRIKERRFFDTQRMITDYSKMFAES